MLTFVQATGDALSSEWALRLLLAVVLGGAVGLEREFHGRPAGLRTHILVCLASTLAMVAGTHLLEANGSVGNSVLRIDPGRIATGVLTGIGFIGAGAIIRLRGTTRGITTAACIWLVASIGVALGMGAYGVAVVGTLLALGVLMFLHQIEKHIQALSYREVTVLAARSNELPEQVRQIIEEMGMQASGGEFEERLDTNELHVTFSVCYRGKEMGQMLARRLRELPDVRTIAWRQVGL